MVSIALFIKPFIAVQQREIDLGVDRAVHCSLYFLFSSIVRKSRNAKKGGNCFILCL